jgi:TRAP-type mannitol/chloroaromatic compound transport system substrate-binding protein
MNLDKILQRRKFLKGAGAIGATLATGIPLIAQAANHKKKTASKPETAAPAVSSNIKQWTMALSWQDLMSGFGTSAHRLAKRISTLSNGQLEIKISSAGAIVPYNGVFNAVAKGTIEMGHSTSAYWQKKSKACAFFSGVPGGFTAQEQNGWLYFGGGKTLWDELYGQFGLIAFPAGNTGTNISGWFNREINSIADFKKLKIRVPALGGDVLESFGATNKSVPPHELFTALQSNIVEALQWAGAWSDLSLGLQHVSKYCYAPAFQNGGMTLELMINKQTFDALSSDLKQIIKIACMVESDILTAEFHANNIRAFNTLKYQHNVDIRQFPKDVRKKLHIASQDIVADVAKQGDIEKRIYESYQQYKNYTLEMNPYAELGFMQDREI